jgi:hypothetical protein
MKEFDRCKTDPLYFFEQHMSLDGGITPYVSTPSDRFVIDTIYNGEKIHGTMGRQTHKSTIIAMMSIWEALFHNHISIVVGSYTRRLQSNMMRLIRDILSTIPDDYKHRISTDDKTRIEFINGSRIDVRYIGDVYTFRGAAINRLYLDDFDFAIEQIDFWSCIYPTIACHIEKRIVILSSISPYDHTICKNIGAEEGSAWATFTINNSYERSK